MGADGGDGFADDGGVIKVRWYGVEDLDSGKGITPAGVDELCELEARVTAPQRGCVD